MSRGPRIFAEEFACPLHVCFVSGLWRIKSPKTVSGLLACYVGGKPPGFAQVNALGKASIAATGVSHVLRSIGLTEIVPAIVGVILVLVVDQRRGPFAGHKKPRDAMDVEPPAFERYDDVAFTVDGASEVTYMPVADFDRPIGVTRERVIPDGFSESRIKCSARLQIPSGFICHEPRRGLARQKGE